MIVGPRFPGDDDSELMWAQHDCYWPVIGRWVDDAKRTFFQAERLLGFTTALGDRLRGMTGFDHRGVQPAHDVMAAHFRRSVHGGRQRSLLVDPKRLTKEVLAAEWWAWLRVELPRLCDDTTITRLLLETCLDSKEPLGAGTNAALERAMAARYDLLRPEPKPVPMPRPAW